MGYTTWCNLTFSETAGINIAAVPMVSALLPRSFAGLEFCSVAIATESTSDAKRTETWHVKRSDPWRVFVEKIDMKSWVWTPPNNTDHQDYYMFTRIFRIFWKKPSFATVTKRGPHANDIHMMIHGRVFFLKSVCFIGRWLQGGPLRFIHGLKFPL